jgi:hypothetical protein
MAGLDELFERMRTRCSWNGARKIEWLEEQCEKLAANPFYWPAHRPDLAAAARERHNKAINAIKRDGGQITRQKLLRHVNPAIIHAMLAVGESCPPAAAPMGFPARKLMPPPAAGSCRSWRKRPIIAWIVTYCSSC